MRFVTRAEWAARTADVNDYPGGFGWRGVAMHYEGESSLAIDHSRCAARMRSVQNFHMDVRGWGDIAYNLAVCLHGYVFEGRGKDVRSASQGTTETNHDYYGILCFLGAASWAPYAYRPTADMVEGIKDAIAYLRRYGAGSEIIGHRDVRSTSCPGEPLYSMVQDGSLDPGSSSGGTTHIVQPGETLKGIANRYGVPYTYIAEVNGLEYPDYPIVSGQELVIPGRGQELDDPDPGTTTPPGGSYTPFPGTEWFKGAPNSPIVTEMGRRLVAEGHGLYKIGPGPQWSDVDRQSYASWQRSLGYSGADADGWPGLTSWDRLRVPDAGVSPGPVSYEPFPGADWFRNNPNSPIVTAMGTRLVAEGCSAYQSGPGPQWSDADRQSYALWQEKLGYSGADADGWPGQSSWDRLRVPRQSTAEYEPFPGADWFRNSPNSSVVTAMGNRLVVERCSRYEVGPGPRWSDVDRQSYALWQEKLGFSGTAADGWPGQVSWDALKVPKQTAGSTEPFPGADWFRSSPRSTIVTAMGHRLVAEGCAVYEVGPGPQWSDADRESYANWQRKLGYSGTGADGWPGQSSWDRLGVPFT